MVPRWKKWLSYLTEIHIESVSSVYNPHLYVSMKDGRFMLSTDKAIYSYADRYDNFGDVLKKINLENIKDVLVLGFGLGSIPYILEKVHKKFYSYTGVEIDEEVIYLASKYVLPDLKSDLHIVEADADTFVQIEQNKYDLIAMDVFESDFIPDRFESIEYLVSLKSILTEDGVLLYNRLAYLDSDISHSIYFLENVFKKVFPEAVSIRVKGNLMLINKALNS